MKRSKNNSRRIKRLERKTVSGSTVVNAFLGSSGGGGVSSFLELSDTPTSYTGESLKAVRVNAGETALEFYTPSAGGLSGSGTTNEIAYFTGATALASLTTATYPSLTELSYVKGVTSAIQTQLNGKLGTGLAWLLASGGTLTGNNEIIGTGYTWIGTWTALGTTQTNGYGLWLRNTTAAAAGSQQASPTFVLEGQGWGTTSGTSQSVKVNFGVIPVQSTTATGTLFIRASLNGGAFTDMLSITTSGILSVSTGAFTTLSSQTLALNSTNGATLNSLTIAGTGRNGTSGTYAVVTNTVGLNPTSGTAIFSAYTYSGTINQTGGANGNVTILNFTPTHTSTGGTFRAFYYNPTVTSITSSHYAWEHTSGFIAWNSILSPAQITSNQNDYAPNGWNNSSSAPYGASILRLSTDASRDLTGLTGGVSGRLVIISNVGAFDLVIKDESASSTAANRLALNNDITLFPDESLMLWYDGTSSRWRPCIKHKTGSTAYTPTNVTTDRSYDANATTLDELADVVGTLIADLQTLKILS